MGSDSSEVTVADRAQAARTAGYGVRPAQLADAAELGRVHTLIWQQTYRGIMSDAYLDGLDPVARGERWTAIIEGSLVARGADAPVPTLLAVAPDGTVAGFISAGPRRGDGPVDLELWALNVLAAHHGSGVAQLLVQEALADAPAFLWVAEGNERAIAFYRKLGFALDGVTKDDEDLGIRDLRMTRR